MQVPRTFYQTQAYRYWQSWQQFWMLFHLWNRITDLERLIAWARHKRLPGPRSYYQSLLVSENQRTMRYAIRSPRLHHRAYVLHRIYELLSLSPTFRRGSAIQYRGANLTR